jgi:hypothetical protein
MKKKIAMQMLEKGKRCKTGWTSIEIKVGKTVRRACVKGKVSDKPSTLSVMVDGAFVALMTVAHALS